MLLMKRKVEIQKDGETKHYTNFYLKLENGYLVPIKPTFSKDYKSLVVLATDLEDKKLS